MKLTEKEMIKIFKNKSLTSLNKDEINQFNIFMFGEEFMKSSDKGKKKTYKTI